jgi:hypothetical protein
MRTKLLGFALLAFALTSVANAATFPITCTLQYQVSTAGGSAYNTPADRVCTAEIVFQNSTHTAAKTRTYSCTIPAGNVDCTTIVDPTASGVPSSYTPVSVVTAPLHSSIEELHGCTYQVLNALVTPPTLYPQVLIETDTLEVVVNHYFDCTSVPVLPE